MAKRVGGCLFADTGLPHSLAQGKAKGSFAVRTLRCLHRCPGIIRIPTTSGWKNPLWVAMLGPIPAQFFVHCRRKGHIAVLASLAIAHEDASRLNIVNGEMDKLIES